MQHQIVKHHGAVNRVQVCPHNSAIVSTWSETGQVRAHRTMPRLGAAKRSVSPPRFACWLPYARCTICYPKGLRRIKYIYIHLLYTVRGVTVVPVDTNTGFLSTRTHGRSICGIYRRRSQPWTHQRQQLGKVERQVAAVDLGQTRCRANQRSLLTGIKTRGMRWGGRRWCRTGWRQATTLQRYTCGTVERTAAST